MASISQPHVVCPKPRIPRQHILSVSTSILNSPELTPHPDKSGLLTPPIEDFNHFLLESRRAQTNSDVDDLSLSNPIIVAVIGVGYVGFQLVQAFAKHYHVIAFDTSKQRIESVRHDFDARSVYLTSNSTEISQATHILIAVPTRICPEDKSVDASHLRSAIRTIATHARSGAVVVVESSVAVGMTRRFLEPLQHSKGCKIGMSPERVDPGRTNIDFEGIPKIVSGLDNESLQAIQQLYEPVFDRVVPVSSCEVAEMTKLYENCQRMIGIAYANEMADACQTLGIDPIEVCSAACTKPFGYQSYLPGAGVGGHCIPVNPYYLMSNMQFPLLEAATKKMWQRPAALATQVMDSLTTTKGERKTSESNTPVYHTTAPTASPRILIVGVAFKPGQSVTSHSPGVAMIDHLVNNYDNVHVEFCDPLVSAEAVPHATKMDDLSDWDIETLDSHYDAIIVAMAQHGLDLDVLSHLQKAKVFNYTSSLSSFGSLKNEFMSASKRDSGVEF